MKVVPACHGSAWIPGLEGPHCHIPAFANLCRGVDGCVISAGELSILLGRHWLRNEPCFDLVQTRKPFFVLGNKGLHCATGCHHLILARSIAIRHSGSLRGKHTFRNIKLGCLNRIEYSHCPQQNSTDD